MKKVNKQCLLDTPRTLRFSEKPCTVRFRRHHLCIFKSLIREKLSNLSSAAVMICVLRVNMLNQDTAGLENTVILDKLVHRSQLARIYSDFYSASKYSLFFNYKHTVE